MTWASRRQLQYFSGLVVFVGLIIFVFLYPIIFQKPTCFDSKQNGIETGVDCGGTCSLMCKEDIINPVVVWSRAFLVTGNDFNLVAFIENRNKDSAVAEASYEFRIYDTNNILLGTRTGKTFIPPNQQFAIFEPRFSSGQSVIKTVTFGFLNPLIWVKKPPILQTSQQSINVSNIVFDNNKNTPNLTALVNNNSVRDIPEFDAIAILYDANNNAINASKTHKDKLLNSTSVPIVFTWPELLPSEPVTKDIMVLINPFLVSF